MAEVFVTWTVAVRPLAPSYLVDDGKITSDGRGGVMYGGHRFEAMVFLGPEYSKETTLSLLESFVKGGGKLLLDGTATRDFEGRDVSARFAAVAGKAVGVKFDVDAMARLGVPKLALDGGAVYEDGSVVLTDLDSLLSGQAKPFSVTVKGHVFRGAYVGLLAISADESGRVEKVAAGGLQELSCDGKTVLRLSAPADMVVRRGGDGRLAATVVGDGGVRIQASFQGSR